MSKLVRCDKETCKTCQWVGRMPNEGMCCDYLMKHTKSEEGGSRLFIRDGKGKMRHDSDLCDRYERKTDKKKKSAKWNDAVKLGKAKKGGASAKQNKG